MPNSIYPIYSLLDVDPYNKGLFRNDSDTYKKLYNFILILIMLRIIMTLIVKFVVVKWLLLFLRLGV